MSRRTPWRWALVTGLAMAAAAVPASASASASTAGGITTSAVCRGSSGVTVVVDYGRAARGIDIRCAPGDPTSGLTTLTGAGLPYTFVPGQPGLVCTIKAVPDPCNGAPVTAYWSYWHLRADRTWQFSSQGAGSYDPAPGAADGWAFGAGTPPRLPAPPADVDRTGHVAVVAGPTATVAARGARRR